MITPFMGEFLTNPFPLELSMNRCTYGCAYCFATLNYRHSHFTRCDVSQIASLLATYRDRNTLTATLLRSQSPVILSNHTDPFCPANVELTRQLLPLFLAQHIPVAFQTKGGVPADVLDMLDAPTFWYITIATDREDVRQRVEPHAPAIRERLALIESLTIRGHLVVVGVNPFVGEWWADSFAMFERFKAMGVHGCWMELLHFNYRQRDQMTPPERAALGDDLISRSMKRKATPEVAAAYWGALEEVQEAGLEVNGGWISHRSDFFTPIYAMFPGAFSTIYEFVNACFDSGLRDTDFITETDFLDFMTPLFPTGRHGGLNSYLGSTNHDLWWTHTIPNKLTYRELLSIIWRNPGVTFHPSYSMYFTIPVFKDGEQYRQVETAPGVPVLSFKPGPHGQYYEFSDVDVAAWCEVRGVIPPD